MKKLLTLLFTFAIAFSLAMPVFAGAQDTTQTETTKTKKSKAAKTKKAKTKTSTTTAPSQ